MSNEEQFIVECDECGQQYENLVGSTPCCGSLAYVVDENGNKTKAFVLYGLLNPKP